MINNQEDLLNVMEKAHQRCLIKLNGPAKAEGLPLFHYTDMNGGVSMLENQTIRFTDIRYLNDPRELDEGLEIYNRVSKRLLPELLREDSLFARVMGDLCHFLNSVLKFDEEVKETKELRDALGGSKIDYQNISYLHSPIYIACFSEHPDDLRQWLPYSNNGKGLSLGFKGVADGRHYFSDTNSPDIRIVKVCYEDSRGKEEYVENMYKEALLVFKNTDFRQEGLLYFFLAQCFNCFLFDMIACKSEKYKDEAEWRLIFTKQEEHFKPRFRLKNGIIRPYIDFSFRKESLERVVLGPNAEDVLNVHALKSLISRKGYTNATIHNSAISYRG